MTARSKAQPSDLDPTGELERIRREHFSTEHFSTEKNIMVLGVALMIAASAIIILGLAEVADDPLAIIICVTLGGSLGLGGWWLRRLDLRGRSIYTGATLLGLLISWIWGDDAPDSFLWDAIVWPLLGLGLVVWSSKATQVMSPRYRDVVIPATPQVQHRVSPKFVLAMFLVLLVIAASIFAAAIE